MPRRFASAPRTALARALVTATVTLSLLGVAPTAEARAGAPTPVTPGDFTGYGFDQCQAPNQKSMNTWLNYSPFLAVGIYISGESRYCRNQTYLNKTWVTKQLRKGWRLLPITLGPQASCSPRYPRWGTDETIIPARGSKGRYRKALFQGRAEAKEAVSAAAALGIPAGSTLWYDLEAFSLSDTNCRESALQFLSGWTQGLHSLDYVSGVYSSSGSGIKMLDDARVNRPNVATLPDHIWIARWDGKANTSAEGIRADGWHPRARMKQYQGGHNETWGGVTINIDRNWIDLGMGTRAAKETHCGGLQINSKDYPGLRAPAGNYVPSAPYVTILKCVLSERAGWTGNMGPFYGAKFQAFVQSWKTKVGLGSNSNFGPNAWMALFASGPQRVVKFGSGEASVRNLQRALNAAIPDLDLRNDGIFGAVTRDAVLRYQKRVGLIASGIGNLETWAALRAGRR